MGIEREREKEMMKKIERPIYGDNEGWRERERERERETDIQRQKEIGRDGERIYEIYNIYTIRNRI